MDQCMAVKYKIPEYYWLNQGTSNLADDEKRFHSVIGDIQKLKKMVEEEGFRNINSQDDIGRSPLYKACRIGNFNVVKYLIEKGADVNAESKKGLHKARIPLHKAVEIRNLEIVKHLLLKGVQIQEKNEDHRTALHIAVWNDDLEIVKCLIQYGADVNSCDNFLRTPLHIAVFENKIEFVKILLQHGAIITAKTFQGETPLHLAKRKGHSDIINLLKEKNAPNLRNTKQAKIAAKRKADFDEDTSDSSTSDEDQRASNKKSAILKSGVEHKTSTTTCNQNSKDKKEKKLEKKLKKKEMEKEEVKMLMKIVMDNPSMLKEMAEKLQTIENSIFMLQTTGTGSGTTGNSSKSRSKRKRSKVEQIDDQTSDINSNSNKEITSKSDTNSNQKLDGTTEDQNENNGLNSERNEFRFAQIGDQNVEASLNSNKEIINKLGQEIANTDKSGTTTFNLNQDCSTPDQNENNCPNSENESFRVDQIDDQLVEASSNSSKEIIIELRQEIANLRMVKDDISAIKDAMNEKLSENIDKKFDSNGQSRLEEVKELKQNLKDLKNEMDDLQEKLDQKNQKLAIQKGKCDKLENQQNILMQILNIPENERNFGTLREALENLKNDYVIEKERAEHLATIS